MSKFYARLDEDNIVAEIIIIPDDANIEDRFAPQIVSRCLQTTGDTKPWMFWNGSSFVVPTPPQPTPDELLATKLGAGIAIVSSGTSSLNGTYSINADTQIQITGVLALIAVGQGLPNDAPTIPWPDVNGAPHLFTSAAFQDFAAAISNYVFGLRTTWAILKQGGSASWPSQPSSIA